MTSRNDWMLPGWRITQISQTKGVKTKWPVGVAHNGVVGQWLPQATVSFRKQRVTAEIRWYNFHSTTKRIAWIQFHSSRVSFQSVNWNRAKTGGIKKVTGNGYLLTFGIDNNRSPRYDTFQEPWQSHTNQNVKYVATNSIWHSHITFAWKWQRLVGKENKHISHVPRVHRKKSGLYNTVPILIVLDFQHSFLLRCGLISRTIHIVCFKVQFDIF